MVLDQQKDKNCCPYKTCQKASLAPVVDAICGNQNGLSRSNLDSSCRQALPSRDMVIRMVEDLRSVLFPGYFGTSELSPESMRFHVGATLDRVLSILENQIMRGMCFVCNHLSSDCTQCESEAREITRCFLADLPNIKAMLATDVQAAYEGDPAATSPDEAIFCYPGLIAITNYRLAHALYRFNVPLLPRIITEYAHSITGVDIHPGAIIGERFFIDHGTGVVIGETSEIGKNVRIFQGVTLGAKSFPLDEHGNPLKGIPRHPIVEDNVVIYSGATILGRITIGRDSMIGGNVWLTHSIPSGSRVTQAQARHDLFSSGAGI